MSPNNCSVARRASLPRLPQTFINISVTASAAASSCSSLATAASGSADAEATKRTAPIGDSSDRVAQLRRRGIPCGYLLFAGDGELKPEIEARIERAKRWSPGPDPRDAKLADLIQFAIAAAVPTWSAGVHRL